MFERMVKTVKVYVGRPLSLRHLSRHHQWQTHCSLQGYVLRVILHPKEHGGLLRSEKAWGS